MYDIKPLEDEWKKYQLKKRKPIYFGISIFVFMISIFASIVNFSYIDNYFDTKGNHSMIKSLSSKNNKSEYLKNNALSRLETEENNKIDVADNLNELTDVLVDIPILDSSSDMIGNSDSPHKKVYLNIIETASAKAYEDVEKRFRQSHDIDDALFLTKSYYKKHNYKKAEYWAYEVNKLDSHLEEGLLIFIQSKVKLGNVSEGIAILKNYIDKSNSEKAKKLLYEIENNK